MAAFYQKRRAFEGAAQAVSSTGLILERVDARQGLALEPFEERTAGGRDIGEVVGNAGMVERGHRVAAAGHRRQRAGAGALGGMTRRSHRGRVAGLDLEVVPWRKVSTDLDTLDAERDLPSEVAVRRGITEPREREGVILRPLVEMTLNNGERVIVKHKGDKFRETAKPRPVVDADKLAVLTQAQEIADEWVTAERLRHVLGKIELDGKVADMSMTPVVIAAMIDGWAWPRIEGP